MTLPEKYDKLITGIVSGLVLPLIIAFFAFIFARGNPDLHGWINKIVDAHVGTHIITLCVFPNVLIFLLFNHFDMLRASRGVLGITIFWAVIVFLVKFLL
jgi:hypothetical protein